MKMKRIHRQLTSIICIISLCISSIFTYPAMAKANSYPVNSQTFTSTINYYESYLESKHSSVLKELAKEKERLQTVIRLEDDHNQVQKLKNLIRNYSNMIDEYEEFLKNQNRSIVPYGVDNPILSPAVSAIVAYFISQNYALAAELLTYAKEESTGGTYSPALIAHVYDTKEYEKLRVWIRTKPSGSSAFEKGSTVADNDLYYAIHGYDYDYSGGSLTITDVYDFAPNSRYDGLAGTAINTMYQAQTLGVIVPYDVEMDLAV